MYAVQQRTAKLVLCALPSESGTASKRKSKTSSSMHRLVRHSLQSSATDAADEHRDEEALLLDVIPAGDSTEWKAICKAFAQHGFRLPGIAHSATQCECFLLFSLRWLYSSALSCSYFLCSFKCRILFTDTFSF
jgi:hypothetical protein